MLKMQEGYISHFSPANEGLFDGEGVPDKVTSK